MKADIPIPIEFTQAVSHSLSLIKHLSTTVSQIDLPESFNPVFFVYLSGDRLYTSADWTLYVYSMSDLTSPIDTYQLDGGECWSGIIADNHLYLSGLRKLHVFEVTTSLTQPLIPGKVIDTKGRVFKLLRVGNELVLGEYDGYL